jgi:signal transduction histidine kinase
VGSGTVPSGWSAEEAAAGLSSDHIAALAAAACGAPLGGVMLIEAGGARIDAAHGFDPASPPSVVALCDRVLREKQLVLVHGDGAAGGRTDDAPIGLFVGAPILTRGGEPLGVLWAADGLPRPCPAGDPGELLLRMATQVALHHEEERTRRQYERALSLVGEAAFRCAPDGTLTWVSPSWVTVTGHPVDGTLNKRLSLFLEGDVMDSICGVLGGAGDDSVHRMGCMLVTAAGAAIPVELAVTRFPGDDEGTRGALGVVTDVRERQRRELEDRHDQKLESLGRLSAGIAHEINTPIQFVGDNTRFLAEAYQGMLDLLQVYRECLDTSAGEVAWDERIARVAAAERDADIDYLTSEVPAAVEQSLEGIDRVASLVRAMKSFSYKDSSDRSYADLNAALTTTLTVARNETKYVADVVLDLGELPEVLCHVGDLNQVFLNLVVNAADALHDRDERGEIRVTTRAEGPMAVITVADNGPGIPKDLQQVIFEPFFTTKGVGKGTGQGLALARAVVADKHGGTIEVHSEPGRGTEFVLRLPVDGKRAGAV